MFNHLCMFDHFLRLCMKGLTHSIPMFSFVLHCAHAFQHFQNLLQKTEKIVIINGNTSMKWINPFMQNVEKWSHML